MESTNKNRLLSNYDVAIGGTFRDPRIAELYIMNQHGYNVRAGEGLYLHPDKNSSATLQPGVEGKWLVSFH